MSKAVDPEILAVIEKLRLFDDTFMSCVFENNKEATALLLSILLERDDLTVKKVTAQRKYTNLLGHSVWLDIVAEDKDHKIYDIEVQRSDDGADPHRARYHSSMLDSRLLKKGEEYAALKDSYVIFITENDYYAEGRSLYHIERYITESGRAFHDGSHILYVNGAYDNNKDPVGRLMHDFRCTKANEMFHPQLAERVQYLKENPNKGGKDAMCALIEEYAKKKSEEAAQKEREAIQKELEEAVQKEREVAEIAIQKERKAAIKQEREAAKKKQERATKKERKETALTLLNLGLLSYEQIAEASKLTVKEVKALDDKRTA